MSKNQHGGARPGTGPKPRTDGRRLRPVKVALTDDEFQAVKDLLTTDERRKVLVAAVKNGIETAADLVAKLGDMPGEGE